MTIISAKKELSPFFFFIQLVSGKHQPGKHWRCGIFRAKFLMRSMLSPLATSNYLRVLSKSPIMLQAIDAQSSLPAKIHRPYLYEGLSVSGRACRLIEHYQFIQTLSFPVLRQIFLSSTNRTLVTLTGKHGENLEVSCRSGTYDREGEITLNLLFNQRRLASLSFSMAQDHGMTSIIIGGLQGPNRGEGNEIDLVREATRASFGLFPKRILMEVVFILAAQMGIEQILAVSDSTHIFRNLRYRHKKKECFLASYSEFWESLKGQQRADKLYVLPLKMPRKAIEDIASKKRSEYRSRYGLMDMLEAQIINNINS